MRFVPTFAFGLSAGVGSGDGVSEQLAVLRILAVASEAELTLGQRLVARVRRRHVVGVTRVRQLATVLRVGPVRSGQVRSGQVR